MKKPLRRTLFPKSRIGSLPIYEMSVIIQQGFPAYFLIVQEYIGLGAKPGHRCWAGPWFRCWFDRCTYAMGITDLEPLSERLAVRAIPFPGTR